jgi:hypothetical protein
MPRSRAERRHHHNRMIQRAKDFFILKWKKEYFSEEEYHKHLSAIAETKKPCSCFMCGNPRHNPYAKSDRLTMQEKRAREALHDEET